MNIGRVIRIAIVVLVCGGFVWFWVWSHQVMPAEQQYVDLVRGNPNIKLTETDRSIVVSSTDYQSKTGLVFLPGAKIDPHAYLYKLSGVVENTGVTVVIAKPYFNLALFDLRPIATYTNDVNNIEKWYIAGHSLGGVRACQYAADSSTRIAGLVLLGSYCDTDVTVPTLSISGSQDALTSEQDIADHRAHLKGEVTIYEIDDASHASFGDYGTQTGDGTAGVDAEFMRLQLTDYLTSWLAKQ